MVNVFKCQRYRQLDRCEPPVRDRKYSVGTTWNEMHWTKWLVFHAEIPLLNYKSGKTIGDKRALFPPVLSCFVLFTGLRPNCTGTKDGLTRYDNYMKDCQLFYTNLSNTKRKLQWSSHICDLPNNWDYMDDCMNHFLHRYRSSWTPWTPPAMHAPAMHTPLPMNRMTDKQV